MTINARTRQAIIRQATKRIEADAPSIFWPAFPGVSKQIAEIVMEVTQELIAEKAA